MISPPTKTIYHPVTGMPCGTAPADDIPEVLQALRGKTPEDKSNQASQMIARNMRTGAKVRAVTGYSAIGREG